MLPDRNPGFGRRLFLRMTTALCAAIGVPAFILFLILDRRRVRAAINPA